MSTLTDWVWRLTVGFAPGGRKRRENAGTPDTWTPGNTPTQSTSTPRTPLHEAARANRLDEVRTLLRRGHPIDPADDKGETPLMLAVRGQFLFVVRALVSGGADPHHANRKGETPASLALTLPHAGIRVALGVAPVIPPGLLPPAP
jgi:ankyrin repeat protein